MRDGCVGAAQLSDRGYSGPAWVSGTGASGIFVQPALTRPTPAAAAAAGTKPELIAAAVTVATGSDAVAAMTVPVVTVPAVVTVKVPAAASAVVKQEPLAAQSAQPPSAAPVTIKLEPAATVAPPPAATTVSDEPAAKRARADTAAPGVATAPISAPPKPQGGELRWHAFAAALSFSLAMAASTGWAG